MQGNENKGGGMQYLADLRMIVSKSQAKHEGKELTHRTDG